ncbi:MAG: DinB family protein, partial [Ginsengibacter sp.]
GVLDRLFTYARNRPLNTAQLHSLSIERSQKGIQPSMGELIELFNRQIDVSVNELKTITPIG